MVKQYTKRHCKTREDKDAPQENVYRAQLTTSSLNHPHTTKDGTEPYPAKPVKDLVKDYKGNRN